MRIAKIEDLHADGGWQTLSFLKVTTDTGLVGWSEFNEGFSSLGLTEVVRKLGATLIGADPRQTSTLTAQLSARARPASGGLNAQAAAALENACLDIKAKDLGVPVYELFGGAFRRRLPSYWSHCAMYRLRRPDLFESRGMAVPKSLADMSLIGCEAVERGFRALKVNVLSFPPDGPPSVHMPGFGFGGADPARQLSPAMLENTVAMIETIRHGSGGQAQILLDLNFNFRPDDVRRMTSRLADSGLGWVEFDSHDPQALARLRQSSAVPVASLESVHGRQDMLPFLTAGAVDVAIIDVMWNGFTEAARMAALADTFEVPVASHVYSGHLATSMGAHFCAVIPNFRVMETDADQVPWLDDLYVGKPEFEGGDVIVPDRPGWGVEIDEAAVARYPPRR